MPPKYEQANTNFDRTGLTPAQYDNVIGAQKTLQTANSVTSLSSTDGGNTVKDIQDRIAPPPKPVDPKTGLPIAPEQLSSSDKLTEQSLQAELDATKTEAQRQADAAENLWNKTVPTADLSAQKKAQIDSIKNTYAAARVVLDESNKRTEKTIETAGIRTGTARYSPEIARGVMASEERASATRIADLNAKEQAAIAGIEQAFSDKEYTLGVQKYEVLQGIQDKKAKAIEDAQTKANEQLQKIQEQEREMATGTGDIGEWLTLNREQSKSGKTPVTWEDYQKKMDATKLAQESAKAYATAYASAKGKATAEKEMGGDVEGGKFSETINNAASLELSVSGRERTNNEMLALAKDGKWSDLLLRLRTQGKKGLPSDVRSEVIKAESNIKAVKRMADVLQKYADLGGEFGYFKGTIDDIATKVGQLVTDPKFKSIATEMKLAFQQYRQDMTGAAFGVQESVDYQSVIASPKSNLDLNLAVMDGYKNYLSNKVDDTFSSVLGDGYGEVKQMATPVSEQVRQGNAKYEEDVGTYGDLHPEDRPRIIQMQQDQVSMEDIYNWVSQQTQ